MNINKLLTSLLILISSIAYSQEKPNILFIAIDDMKPLIANYGTGDVITPNIDKLTNSGTVFLNAYCQFPVCGPSRASIMTGLRPEVTGILDLKTRMRDVNPNALTIPQHFKNNGYQTAGKGKIFDPRCVESRAKDDPESWTIPYEGPKGAKYGFNKKYGKKDASWIVDAPDEEFHDGVIRNQGIDELEIMASKNEPFFLAVGFKKPHLPFNAPKKYYDLYKREDFKIASYQDAPPNSNSKYVLNNNNELLSYNPVPTELDTNTRYSPFEVGKSLSVSQQQELLHGYFACVSFVDAQIGLLLASLEKTGKAENTIIVLWGDHGFHLGDHGMWGKHTTMEQAARVPMIISGKGIIQQKSQEIVELIDLFPTLCELSKLDVPNHLNGKSIAPILASKENDSKGYAITQYKRNGAFGYSIRTEKYRYTEWVDGKGEVVYSDLYNLEDAFIEDENILEKTDKKEINKLKSILREHKEELRRYK